MAALYFSHSGWCPELKKSYEKGYYEPKNEKEFKALKKYAAKIIDDKPEPEKNEGGESNPTEPVQDKQSDKPEPVKSEEKNANPKPIDEKKSNK